MSDHPETPNPAVTRMRLRPQPRPVLRLSRKMLIGAGAVVSAGLMAALAVAIQPRTARPQVSDTVPPPPSQARPSTEALNGLPRDYASVPKLGPPLPGDFGRPILSAQRTGADGSAGVSAPDGIDPAAAAPPPRYGAAVRTSGTQTPAIQARTAARTSQLFFAPSGGSAPIADPAPRSGEAGLGGQMSLMQPLTAAAGSQTDAERKRAFLNQATDPQTVSGERLRQPSSPYLLLTGSVIPAALITGIRSDIPGQVLAQVTEDVRDSVTGRYLLIPKGARLIGQYDNGIGFGQSRLLLTWSRLIMPNGASLLLEKLSAADAGGYAGLQDRTDYHWAGIVNAAAVSTLLGIGTQSGNPDDDSALVRALRDGAADSINRAGQAIVERQLTVQPTLTIRPGLPVRVILSRDLILEPYGDGSWPN